MQLFQLIGIAFVTGVTALLLRSTRPELSFAVTVAGCIILLLLILDLVKDSLSIFGSIAEGTGIDAALIKSLLKMIGIGYLVEFSAGPERFRAELRCGQTHLCGKDRHPRPFHPHFGERALPCGCAHRVHLI